MQETGFFWHVHHGVLVEWCFGYKERVEFIKTGKPQKEVEMRLKLFKPVQGELPRPVIEAKQACEKAKQACYKVWQAYDKAKQAYNETLVSNKREIERLHTAECPNCPWDRHTIFPAA